MVEQPTLSDRILRHYLPRVKWRRRMMKEQRANFDEKYPEDAYTAFLVSGQQFFDKDILVARKRELFGFKPYQMKDEGGGQGWKIFFPRVPNKRYLMGCDNATGLQIGSDDTDYCTAVVLDLETGEEMAAYRARIVPQDFAFDLSELGTYFNNALIAVERTGYGGTTILTLAGECQYGAIYKHRDWVKRNKQVTDQTRRLTDFEGFPTTTKTRPIALNFLNQFVQENPQLIWDSQFIDEALTFVRDERGIPRAQPGSHDDTVSARWIAHFVRRVQLGWFVPWESKRERYTPADQITGVE